MVPSSLACEGDAVFVADVDLEPMEPEVLVGGWIVLRPRVRVKKPVGAPSSLFSVATEVGDNVSEDVRDGVSDNVSDDVSDDVNDDTGDTGGI